MKEQFKEQILEDIKLIQEQYSEIEPKLNRDEYAFNHWILGRIYNIDEEIIPDQIVEYKDFGLDCYVHYEDSKELFIIQNKYYDESTVLDRKYVSDFLKAPMSELKNGSYKRKRELQEIFNKAVIDENYKIYLHFYITNNKENPTINNLFNQFNIDNVPTDKYKSIIQSKIYYLDDIYELYYGKTFKEKKQFKFDLKTTNKGTILRILPKEYNLSGMSPAHYIMTPVSVIYNMYKEAIRKQYPLFEENIREYLGRNPINNGIMKTLKNENDRKNFFYYNNGITVICEEVSQSGGSGFTICVSQPQVVNGCQTVNTIFEVLDDYAKKDETLIEKEFGNVYVMVKVLIFDENVKTQKPTFYKDIVKYTNSQNAINEKAFASDKNIFFKLQLEFEQRGFLILVQPSDKNKYKNYYKDKSRFNSLINLARKYTDIINLDISLLTDIMIPLEKLLQVYLALMTDGYHAYSKKSNILNPQSDYYQKYSLIMHHNLTFDNLLRMYLIFKKAELDKSRSDDKKTPIPYYLIGFLGYFIENKDFDSLNKFFRNLFQIKKEENQKIYDYICDLTNLYKIAYKNAYKEEYNSMIKQKIDLKILKNQIELLNSMNNYKDVNKLIDNLLC